MGEGSRGEGPLTFALAFTSISIKLLESQSEKNKRRKGKGLSAGGQDKQIVPSHIVGK